MKNTLIIATFILLMGFTAEAQGPFIGANVSPRGFAGVRAGWSYFGLLDLSVTAHPVNKKLNNGGYGALSLKVPLRYFAIADYYGSGLLGGLFFNYNAGTIFMPVSQADLSNQPKYYSKAAFAGSWSLGTELMFIKSGLALSLPVEFGRGKMLFNQEFKNQVDANGSYTLNKSYFVSAGLRIYFSKNHCKDATRDLQIGYQ
jgi:hypothetical protein